MMERHYETQAWARPVGDVPWLNSQVAPQYPRSTTSTVYVPVPVTRPSASVKLLAFLLGLGLSAFLITMAILMMMVFAAGPS